VRCTSRNRTEAASWGHLQIHNPKMRTAIQTSAVTGARDKNGAGWTGTAQLTRSSAAACGWAHQEAASLGHAVL
jgi:hypothetical protein